MGRTNETKSVNNTNNKSMLIIAFGINKKKCKILGFVASWQPEATKIDKKKHPQTS